MICSKELWMVVRASLEISSLHQTAPTRPKSSLTNLFLIFFLIPIKNAAIFLHRLAWCLISVNIRAETSLVPVSNTSLVLVSM